MSDLVPTRLGVTVIDSQHARLFDLINQLEDHGAGLAALLTGFEQYAERHFLVEEELMKAHDYPGLAMHLAAHDAYRKRFTGLRADALSGSPVLVKAMLTFLQRWWVDHVGTVDRDLATFLRTRGMHAPMP